MTDDWRDPDTPPAAAVNFITEHIPVMLRYADGTELRGTYHFTFSDFLAHAFLARDEDRRRALEPYVCGDIPLVGWKPLQ